MVILIMLIALVLAAPYILQLWREDTTINPNEFNKALAILNGAKKSPNNDHPAIYKKAATGTIIELNTADSAKLTGLPGIGPSFAHRIMSYRSRLGGFIRKEQLKEVFGMDEDMYSQLASQVAVDVSLINKIHINKVDFDGLSHFPYLTFKQMNAIIQFREQHGQYSSLDDMRNIAILNNEILRKIGPYIDFK